MIGDAAQYEELVRLYGEFGDDELVALGRDMSDLTDVAQEVLKAEIARRRLTISAGTSGSATSTEARGKASRLERFASLAPEHCVWEFAESEDALAAGEALRAEGIECDVILPSAERFVVGAPRVAVLPEDADRAEAILSQPIAEEFYVLVRTRDQFVVPSCPKCGAADPLLESIEPTNHWRCDACEHEWSERVA